MQDKAHRKAMMPHTWNLVGADDATGDTRKWHKAHKAHTLEPLVFRTS